MAGRKTGRGRRTPSGRWTSVSTLPGVAAPTDPGRVSPGRSRHGTTGERRSVRGMRGRSILGRKKRSANRKRSSTSQHPVVKPGSGRRLFSRLLSLSARRDRGSWPKALGVLVALGAVALGGYAGYRFITSSHYFAVRKVTISPTEHVSRAELQALAALSSKDNIFSVDLPAVAARVASHPWVLSARARRHLPGEIRIEVVEQEPAAAVLMGGLYLVNASGALFKRASFQEARVLPLITGISRDTYENERAVAGEKIRTALEALRAYASRKGRPLLGEVHVDERNAVTLYSRKTGLQIRLGRGAFLTKLSRFDAVWAALGDRRRLLRVVRLDNRVRPERVTVRLAQDGDGIVASEPGGRDAAAPSSGQPGKKKAGGGAAESGKKRPEVPVGSGTAQGASSAAGRARTGARALADRNLPAD